MANRIYRSIGSAKCSRHGKSGHLAVLFFFFGNFNIFVLPPSDTPKNDFLSLYNGPVGRTFRPFWGWAWGRGWDRLLKYNFWVLKKMSKKSRKQKFSPCFSSSFCYSSPSSFPILSGRSELKSYPFFF